MSQRKLDALADDEVFADWKETLEASYAEMIELGQNRRTFEMLREIAEGNQRLRETGGHREWRDANSREFLADLMFDGFGVVRLPGHPDQDHFDPAVAAADLDELEATTENVRRYVEQTFGREGISTCQRLETYTPHSTNSRKCSRSITR